MFITSIEFTHYGNCITCLFEYIIGYKKYDIPIYDCNICVYTRTLDYYYNNLNCIANENTLQSLLSLLFFIYSSISLYSISNLYLSFFYISFYLSYISLNLIVFNPSTYYYLSSSLLILSLYLFFNLFLIPHSIQE